MLSFFRNNLEKSKAAVVVQNLHETQVSLGQCEPDPRMGNKLVGIVWDWKPDLFSGSFGQRPHKLSVAAMALAAGSTGTKLAEGTRVALLLSLGTIIEQYAVNGNLYAFNGIDEHLFKLSIDSYKETALELGLIPSEENG